LGRKRRGGSEASKHLSRETGKRSKENIETNASEKPQDSQVRMIEGLKKFCGMLLKKRGAVKMAIESRGLTEPTGDVNCSH